MLDRFLAARHLDRAVVFAGGEFTLHENVCAFGEAWSDLREALPVFAGSVAKTSKASW